MFGFFSLGENLLDGPTIEDLFEAIAKHDQTVIDEYFKKTFDDVKEKIIATQDAKGEGHGQQEIDPSDINSVVDGIVGDIPDFAVTEKCRADLEKLAESFSNQAFRTMGKLQNLDLKMGDKIKTPEEEKAYKDLQSKVEFFGISRVVTLRFSTQMENKLATQGETRTSSCTIL